MLGAGCQGTVASHGLKERISPGLGRVTRRLPGPSQSETDGLASDLSHTQSLSGGVAVASG
jgi:hypothetical protein